MAINYKFNRKIYYVKYEGKWQRLYYISEQLRRDGLVYGFKNTIKTLRSRYDKNKKAIIVNEKQQYKDQSMEQENE